MKQNKLPADHCARPWFGPYPLWLCEMLNVAKIGLITTFYLTCFFLFVLRFFFVVIWKKMKIIEDHLLSSLVRRITFFLGKNFDKYQVHFTQFSGFCAWNWNQLQNELRRRWSKNYSFSTQLLALRVVILRNSVDFALEIEIGCKMNLQDAVQKISCSTQLLASRIAILRSSVDFAQGLAKDCVEPLWKLYFYRFFTWSEQIFHSWKKTFECYYLHNGILSKLGWNQT